MTLSGTARAAAWLALAIVVPIAAVEWFLAVFQPEGGPLGVVQILAPHLAIGGLILAPVALAARRRAAVIAVGALIVVTAGRFGGDWVSIPPAAAAAQSVRLTAVTWNLEVGARTGADTVAMLRAHEADLVALQELRPEVATAIDGDPELARIYPYRALVPREDVGGMGLLSRVPLDDGEFRLSPILQLASLDLGGGRRIAVVNAHPFHADIATLGPARLPVGLDPARRNADLETIRGRVDGLIRGGRQVVLLGDLNTTDSEPAFDRFAAGLRDVHAEVGEGTGWTWRPIRFEFLGLGLLRIDHVIVSPDIFPIGTGVACPPAGDHCLVRAELAIPAPG